MNYGLYAGAFLFFGIALFIRLGAATFGVTDSVSPIHSALVGIAVILCFGFAALIRLIGELENSLVSFLRDRLPRKKTAR